MQNPDSSSARAPLVSVVVPTYNAAAHIVETLDSILNQTYPSVELIVVDDGSTDRTCEIVRGYGERVRLAIQANQGVSTARNHGLRLATGEFVCFVDHDDYWHPDKLELQMAVYAQDPELGLVSSNIVWWRPDADGRYPAPESFQDTQTGLEPKFSGWIYHELLLDSVALTSSAVIRREALLAVGGFDESLAYSEDWDLWLRLSRHYRFAHLRRKTTLYRQLASQGSRKFRAIDFRTRLLNNAVEQWGYASPDGKSVSRTEFCKHLARCHVEYAFSCLKAGKLAMANRSFISAWRARPANVRPLVYLLAGSLGWRPSWL